jgi:hypothetical protein
MLAEVEAGTLRRGVGAVGNNRCLEPGARLGASGR